MVSKKQLTHITSLILICLSILFIISACRARPPQPAAPTLGFDLSSDELDTPEPTLGFDLSFDETETPNLNCPNEKTLYNLWIIHEAVLDIDAGDGETFYLKFENKPPSFFQLWINPSGIISTDLIINLTEIEYHGIANHPKDADCPVQTFNGIWEMQAEISGVCQEGIVNLHIIEEWIDPVLHSSCGDPIGSVPGTVSAPELDLRFDLSSDIPADGITIPEGGPFHASYRYHLTRPDFDLPMPYSEE